MTGEVLKMWLSCIYRHVCVTLPQPLKSKTSSFIRDKKIKDKKKFKKWFITTNNGTVKNVENEKKIIAK